MNVCGVRCVYECMVCVWMYGVYMYVVLGVYMNGFMMDGIMYAL